ncbi:hypothetical protein KP509_06G019200 [Ceratopteris richardii]|uniref:Uncharacterized protein n=1 Tax=Ceratopteris richardii TaxID=49495 RepID=A0A8T2UQI4_CERRI|nr:hypothetical protein KP509_06G019200 [Ceratopteris richardii]
MQSFITYRDPPPVKCVLGVAPVISFAFTHVHVDLELLLSISFGFISNRIALLVSLILWQEDSSHFRGPKAIQSTCASRSSENHISHFQSCLIVKEVISAIDSKMGPMNADKPIREADEELIVLPGRTIHARNPGWFDRLK